MKNTLRLAVALFVVLLFALPLGLAAHWMINRVYVDEGYSLLLQYKGPLIFGSRKTPEPGHFADYENGEIGILEQMPGPGRHWYCPIWWKTELVPDKLVKPGEVAVVTSKLGNDLPPGDFLVDGALGETQFKGVLRTVYGPGRYRVNPYAYEFTVIETQAIESGDGQTKYAGWVEIPTGFVGVVTHLADNPITGAKAGIQMEVLQPGIYPVNPREEQIDIIEIGLRERTVAVTTRMDKEGNVVFDASGEPEVQDASTGINFPSKDAFTIAMDFTTVWGILPEQAPHAVMTFGNVAAVEGKVVVPQIESICRNMGSSYNAEELLIGESRQKFQDDTSRALREVLHEKQLTLLYGLVRHIYIPSQVREPIQRGSIADELKLTRDQEQLTARTEARLREAERQVELEAERVKVDTEKMVAKVQADGEKKARETDAETTQLVAAIDRQTAGLEAQATIVQGQAQADAEQMLQEAEAQRFQLAVQSFGSGEAYNQWTFASGLPENIELKLLYAGEGTFWTDLEGFVPAMLGSQLQQAQQQKPSSKPAPKPTR